MNWKQNMAARFENTKEIKQEKKIKKAKKVIKDNHEPYLCCLQKVASAITARLASLSFLEILARFLLI